MTEMVHKIQKAGICLANDDYKSFLHHMAVVGATAMAIGDEVGPELSREDWDELQAWMLTGDDGGLVDMVRLIITDMRQDYVAE